MADAADRKRNVRIAFQSDDKGDDNYQKAVEADANTINWEWKWQRGCKREEIVEAIII